MSAAMNVGAELARQLDERCHFFQMRAAAERALLRRGLERVAHPQGPCSRGQLGEELRGQRFVYQNARTTKTDLPLVGETGAHGGVQRERHVRVLKDDERIFPAEFEGEALEHRSGG